MNWFRPHFDKIDYSKLPTSKVPLLLNAHAHNDYLEAAPLWRALHHGYTYIEADVHLIRGRLYAYHRRPLFPMQSRSLDQLYLKPLFDLFQERGGFIFPNDPQQTLHLLIDIKTDALRTFEVLEKELQPYLEMITTYEGNQINRKAISVMVSGNRPLKLLNAATFRLACVDGRMEDLGKGYSTALMPLVSASYTKLFGWFSKYSRRLSSEQIKVLRKLIVRTQAEGKLLRFWNSPESEKIWAFLLEEGVDVINTDHLKRLQRFLVGRDNPIV